MRVRNPALTEDLDARRPLALSIGAGGEAFPDGYTLDGRDLPGIDVVADLEEPLDALPDRSVERVVARHVLEHIVGLDGLLDELHRVLTPTGRLEVVVPHWANPLGHSDPTHVRLFGLYSFCYFVPLDDQPLARKVPTYRSDRLFHLDEVGFGFRGAPRLERWVNATTGRLEWYERNMARFVWPYEVNCVLTPI